MFRIWRAKRRRAQFRTVSKVLMNLWEMPTSRRPLQGSRVSHGCEALMKKKKDYYVEIQAEHSCVFRL